MFCRLCRAWSPLSLCGFLKAQRTIWSETWSALAFCFSKKFVWLWSLYFEGLPSLLLEGSRLIQFSHSICSAKRLAWGPSFLLVRARTMGGLVRWRPTCLLLSLHFSTASSLRQRLFWWSPFCGCSNAWLILATPKKAEPCRSWIGRTRPSWWPKFWRFRLNLKIYILTKN